LCKFLRAVTLPACTERDLEEETVNIEFCDLIAVLLKEKTIGEFGILNTFKCLPENLSVNL
jgi:hypothetical protein